MKAGDWFFEPGDFIRYFRSTLVGAKGPVRLPRQIVLVFGESSFDAFSKALRAHPVSWNPRIALGRAGSRAVGVIRSSIGSPAAAIELEEAIALGARSCVAFGACGSLRGDLRIGQTVLPTGAFSDEGTSHHYGGGRWAHPDPVLLDRLRIACRKRSLPVLEGAVWTTDAVYRESRSQARRLARRGVVGVEMEASALFTVGAHRRARVAGLFVVSDELARERWMPGFGSLDFRNGIRTSVRAVVDVMAGGGR